MEDTIIAFGTAAGAFVATMLVVIVFGYRLWRGLGKVLAGNDGLKKVLGEAMGAGEGSDDGLHHHRGRRHTGAFQAIVREELDTQLKPVIAKLDKIAGETSRNTSEIARNTGLIDELSEGHNKVAQRTARHSAALNLAAAEQTLTKGVQVR